MLALIESYRLIFSHTMGGSCRFTPSCSEYAQQAVRTHPPLKALQLILQRLIKCRPGGPYGLDPIPSVQEPQ